MSEIEVRKKTIDPFTKMPNKALEDRRLSYRAKGILAYLLGRPPQWINSVKDIQNQSTEGRDAIRAAMKELEQAGYATIVNNIVDGLTIGKRWVVTDIPRPQTAFQAVGNPVGGVSSPYNKKDGIKKKAKRKHPDPPAGYPNEELLGDTQQAAKRAGIELTPEQIQKILVYEKKITK